MSTKALSIDANELIIISLLVGRVRESKILKKG